MDTMKQEMDEMFPGKPFLTLEEVAKFLNCSEEVVYNWNKRSDPKRRPPRLMVGKAIRFPKKDFAQWLVNEFIVERE